MLVSVLGRVSKTGTAGLVSGVGTELVRVRPRGGACIQDHDEVGR